MAAAGEPTTAGKRKNRVVAWPGGGGGGGGLLLLGGALAATAALGVAFIVRAATKKKTEKAKGSLQESGEKKGSDTTCSSEGRAEEGEERGGLPSLLPPPPPPPQASPQPPPPPKEEENSSLKREQTLTGDNPSAVSEESGADGSSATMGEAATVQKSDFLRVEEKIIKESLLIRGRHGEGVEDVLPAIVNKDVVVDESKIIQVVGGEAPLEETAPADGSAREGEEEDEEEEEGPPVEERAEKSSGGTRDPSMAEAEPPQVVRPAKTMEPSLPSVEVIQNPKPVVMMTIKEEVFLGTGQKLGVEVAEAPWKADRMVAEMREKGVMDRIVVEMREKRFSRNAQVVILVSTVFCTTLLAILLHHYGSRLLESTLV